MILKKDKFVNVQAHGDGFENKIHLAVHGKTKREYEQLIEGGHIAKFDIVKGTLSTFNGSVKVTKGHKVGCGDIIRMYTGTKDNIIIFIIGVWKQSSKKVKKYNKVYEFYIDPSHHSLLWKDMQLDTLEKFDNYVKSIPHGKESQLANQKLWKEKRKNIYDLEGQGLMSIDAKIDSKKQRRVQCGFDIEEMMESGIPYTIFTKEYRGISLPYIQNNSPARVFK